MFSGCPTMSDSLVYSSRDPPLEMAWLDTPDEKPPKSEFRRMWPGCLYHVSFLVKQYGVLWLLFMLKFWTKPLRVIANSDPWGHRLNVKDMKPLYLSEMAALGGALRYKFVEEKEIFGLPFLIYQHVGCNGPLAGIIFHSHDPVVVVKHDDLFLSIFSIALA